MLVRFLWSRDLVQPGSLEQRRTNVYHHSQPTIPQPVSPWVRYSLMQAYMILPGFIRADRIEFTQYETYELIVMIDTKASILVVPRYYCDNCVYSVYAVDYDEKQYPGKNLLFKNSKRNQSIKVKVKILYP